MEERYTSGKFNGGDRGMPAKALKEARTSEPTDGLGKGFKKKAVPAHEALQGGASMVRHIGLDGEI